VVPVPLLEISGIMEVRSFHEEITIQRNADIVDPEASLCWPVGQGDLILDLWFRRRGNFG